MLPLPLLLLAACVPENGDAPARRDLDSAIEAKAPCVEGKHDNLPEPWSSDRGNSYRVVEVPLDEGGAGLVLVTFPPEGQALWSDGAGVVVVSPPSHKPDETWQEHPQSWSRASWGIVEVIALWPGWTVQGLTSPGTAEGGGEASAAVFRAALNFAVGGLSSEGRPLEDYAEVPVCNQQVSLFSLSSGGAPLLQAVAEGASVYADRIAGVSLFEPPSIPELVVAESGAIWMDPDLDTDADDDGLTWNDARNQDLDPATCTVAGCSADYHTLTYTDALSLAPVWSGYPADLPAGLLFFDRDLDGVFSVDEHGPTDKNGDGRVGRNEDQWSRPMFAIVDDTYQLYYSSSMANAAGVLGLVPDSAAHFATPEATEAWWARRSMGPWAAEAGAAIPEAAWSLVFTEMPHGPALVERTGEWIVWDELTLGGAAPRWNFPKDIATCMAGGVFAEWVGPPPADAELVGADLHAWAVPDTINVPGVG